MLVICLVSTKLQQRTTKRRRIWWWQWVFMWTWNSTEYYICLECNFVMLPVPDAILLQQRNYFSLFSFWFLWYEMELYRKVCGLSLQSKGSFDWNTFRGNWIEAKSWFTDANRLRNFNWWASSIELNNDFNAKPPASFNKNMFIYEKLFSLKMSRENLT